MALSPAFVGRTYPPGEPYEVGREKIREFAEAIGDGDTASAAGGPGAVAPPTFAIVLAMRASAALIDDPELGLDYTRVVHGEQRFVHHRPLRPGDRLVATLTVEKITSRAGNDILGTRTEITADGDAVVTAYSTLVARGTA